MAFKTRNKKNELDLMRQIAEMGAQIDELQAKVTGLVALTTELKADMSGHVHGGVTAGAADTAAGPVIAAAAVVI